MAFILWFTIENYVVIIAASVPSLRPLLLHFKKQKSSTASSSYAMNTYGTKSNRSHGKCYVPYGEGRDGTLKSFSNKTDVEGGAVGKQMVKLPDSESEEYILPIMKTEGRGITKRTEISVSYIETGGNDLESGE